jgi:pimeloyl-ACP methyl ester carboxylesterase
MISLGIAAALMAAPAPAFVERPCSDTRLVDLVRCGTVEVPEDRGRPNGRTIALNIMVLPATGPGEKLPPLFDIDGGPGLPATKNVGFYLSFAGAYRVRRDILLVDQRGTGGSNPLHCPQFSAPEAAYRPLYPADAVAACRKALEPRADLARYGTADAVADLDAVRAALGHERVDLFGLSYGTTVALRYLAAYRDRVRAAVLMSVAPPAAMPPSGHAPAAERALNLLFERCEADAACAAAFDPAADLPRAVARLASIEGSPRSEIFLEKLRSLMYQPSSARRLPYIVSRAAAGDLAPFYAATRPQGPSLYADGMHLSVICTESMGLMDYEAAEAAARPTRFGDYRLRRQREACAQWPKGEVPAGHLAPVASDVPTLLISGGLDPVTPPEWAAEVARHLPNSRHLVIPDAGHILDGLSAIDTCFDPLVVRFLDTADAKSLDAACLAEMKPPPFATAEPAPKP